MSWSKILRWIFGGSRDQTGDAADAGVSQSIIEHKEASTKSLASSEQFFAANGELREAVRLVNRSTAFAGFERAIRDGWNTSE